MTADNITLTASEARGTAGAVPPSAQDIGPHQGARADLPFAISPPSAADTAQAAHVLSRSGVHLEIYDLDEVAGEWKAFERRADHLVFQSFDWLATWQRHVGTRRGTIPAIIVGREIDGETLFILPLAVETRRSFRRLSFLASRLCDYNAPLLAQNFSARVSTERFLLAWRDVLALLRTQPRLRFDFIDLEKMPERVGEQRNPFLDLAVQAHPSGAYLTDLGREWNAFYAQKRSSATRKRERRQLRQLAEHGKLCFVNVEDEDEITRTLTALIEQKSRVFARMGVDDRFARPGVREFFLAVALDPGMRELVHVSRLDVGTQIVAASVGLRLRDCYYLILSSYDDGELSRFGPGRAQLNELLRHVIEQGFRLFDFTVGDEPYKRDWYDSEVVLYDSLGAATIRGWAIAEMTAVFRRLKRHIKRSPGLWRAFSRARALAGLVTASRP
jgi:CelD/BcsL family acetyltransferase involved in cellulose biosynthesis